MWALAASALAADEVAAVSPDHLVVHLSEDTAFSRAAADWVLDCAGARQAATALAVRTAPVDLVPEGWPYRVVVAHDVVLGFDAPIPVGSCSLGDGAVAVSYTHDPDLGRTPALHLNQVGFAPGRAHAAISYWVPGTRLALETPAFRVIDADSGATALTGEATLRAVTADDAYGNDYTQAEVWDLDLSALGEGSYAVVWEGVGRSWTFRVASDAWDDPFYVAFRGLFHQRCGGALPPELTAWSHAACHTDPVEETSADYQVVGEDAFSALPAAALGTTVDAHGGWHDAADYDRNWGHLRLIDDLVDLYALDPALHGRDDLGLPESGNGLPDLLDEATWGMTTWSRLQAEDGGIPGCVGTTGYPDLDEMPDADDGVFYACAADPVASYQFAAAAAKLGAALAGRDDAASADWLDRASRAWAWAEANPRGYDATLQAGNAAASLFAATGDTAWEDVFLARGPLADPGFVLADWDGEEWHEALYTYAQAPSGRERARAIAVLDGRAASWLAWAKGSSWRIAKHPYAPITNGTGTTPVGAGLLLRVAALTGNPEYAEWASYAADVTLGANPSGWSWTTGLGDQPVRDPLHTPSLGDGIAEPVPGITVYGPSYLTSGSDNVGVALAAFDPPIDQWPLLERYADVAYVPNMNEFTVVENIGPTLFAFGALASWTAPPGDTGADPGSDPADPPEDAEAGAKGGAGGCGCGSGGLPSGAWVLAAVFLRRRRS
jgi:endoglucanase